MLAAYYVSRLSANSRVLEIGAGTSDLEELVRVNFRRTDIEFIKVDADEQYKEDINGEYLDSNVQSKGKFNTVIMMVAVEHVGKNKVEPLFEKIYKKWLVDEGILIVTTPTLPYNCLHENKVWPTDYKYEFSSKKIRKIVNIRFKIIHEMSWSIEKRDYYKEICSSSFLMEVKARLEKADFPESYIRAQIAGRQILIIAKARRKAE